MNNLKTKTVLAIFPAAILSKAEIISDLINQILACRLLIILFLLHTTLLLTTYYIKILLTYTVDFENFSESAPSKALV